MGSPHPQAAGPQPLPSLPTAFAMAPYFSRTASWTCISAMGQSPRIRVNVYEILGGSCYICQDAYMNKEISGVERLFQALGDATRLRILGLLLAGENWLCD